MTIDGVLLDIDGVLVVSWQPLPGAVDTVTWLRSTGLPFRLLTNTTTRSRRSLAGTLQRAGFDIGPGQIMTAPVATAAYLRKHHHGKGCFLIVKGDVTDDFEDIPVVEEDAEVVVIGGAEDEFTYQTLNSAFRMLRDGAALVAMHRNLWWMTEDGPMLDAGAFIAGLEAATGVEAEVTGKPARSFFEAAVSALGAKATRTAMVGDSIDSDVLAAQEAGLVGILVRTGKFEPSQLPASGPQPAHVLDSISDLPDLLN